MRTTASFCARSTSRLLILAALATSLLGSSTFDLESKTSAAQNAPDPVKLTAEKQLEEAATKFISALKEPSPDRMMEQFSKDGVSFGIDSEPLPWSHIREKMKKGESLYCLFFDTQGLRKNPNFQKQTALRDVLLKGSSYRMRVAIEGESRTRTGFVRLFVETGNDESTQEFCDLGYRLENGSWKISEVQYL